MNIVTRTYESLLPFLVVEAISSQKSSFNSMSVRMMEKGWAWLVKGRELLIWRFKDNKSAPTVRTRRMLSPCFELQLPQSDLVHRADLVHVFFMPQNPNTSTRSVTVPAALVVSPEGVIRIWSNIANERYTESSVAEVQGQEFCCLAPLSSFEYLLGTTTGSLYILTIDISSHDPKGVIVCSALTEPSGILSGFGRRVTNLFFGPMTTEISADARRPLIAVPKYSQSTIDKTGSVDRPFFVLSSSLKLRQWARTSEGINSVNHLVREWDLQGNVQAEIISKLGLSDSDRINFWPVDMITTKTKELLILLVTLNPARNNAVNYATCIFNPYQAGDSLSSLTILRSHTWNYSNESEDQLLALRFLERRTTTSPCFVYDKKFLFLVQVEQDILDAIDYGIQDDSILGAGMVDGHPILFTQRDGLTYVVPVASNKSRFDETSIQFEPSMTNASRREATEASQTQQTRIAEPNRSEPMLVEIDVDDAEEEKHDRPSRLDSSRQGERADRNQSRLNKSSSDTSSTRPSEQSMDRKKDDMNEILKENTEFEWVRQIDSKQYGLASETLAKLANESETLKDRKDTLLALSKLAQLAE